MTIFSVTLLCLPLAASAQSMEDKIKSLEATVEQLQETLMKMRDEMEKSKEASASKSGGVVRTDGENITVSTTGGGIKMKSDNGNAFQFGGRLMWDYDNYDFDGPNIGDEGDSSEAQWRRLRFTTKGTVKKDWHYELTINFREGEGGAANDSSDVNMAYIKYTGFKPVTMTLGHFKEPFSLERLASSNSILTIERGMILDVVNEGHGQPENGGFMVSGAYPEMANLNWALGIFDDDREDEDGDDNYAITGRVAVAPSLNFGNNSFMHLGAAFSNRERDNDRYRVRTRYGISSIGRNHECPNCRTTLGDLPAGDDIMQWGLEGAFVTGPFSLQAEYVDLEVDGGTAFNPDGTVLERYNDLEADGYYIQGAWTITGEQRRYKTSGGFFDKVKPKGPYGAWELVARYEEIDVEYDGVRGTRADATDNEAEKMLLGLNWYPNNNLKFMLNYIDAEGELPGQDVDADAISFRAQYAF